MESVDNYMLFVRQALMISQARLSRELGISVRQISKIESGQVPLQWQTKLALECLLWRANMIDRQQTAKK